VCEKHRQPIRFPYGHYLVIIVKYLHTIIYYKVWLMSYLFCIGQEPRYRTLICRRRILLIAANSIVNRFFKFNLIFPSKKGRQITSIIHLDQVCQALEKIFVPFNTACTNLIIFVIHCKYGTVLYKFYNVQHYMYQPDHFCHTLQVRYRTLQVLQRYHI
jgi:hypothetical protein